MRQIITDETRKRVVCEHIRDGRTIASLAYRGNGYVGDCLDYAMNIAKKENCYKMMSLTGSKKPETLRFYEKSGYNSSDKTAFIQWLGVEK